MLRELEQQHAPHDGHLVVGPVFSKRAAPVSSNLRRVFGGLRVEHVPEVGLAVRELHGLEEVLGCRERGLNGDVAADVAGLHEDWVLLRKVGEGAVGHLAVFEEPTLVRRAVGMRRTVCALWRRLGAQGGGFAPRHFAALRGLDPRGRFVACRRCQRRLFPCFGVLLRVRFLLLTRVGFELLAKVSAHVHQRHPQHVLAAPVAAVAPVVVLRAPLDEFAVFCPEQQLFQRRVLRELEQQHAPHDGHLVVGPVFSKRAAPVSSNLRRVFGGLRVEHVPEVGLAVRELHGLEEVLGCRERGLNGDVAADVAGLHEDWVLLRKVGEGAVGHLAVFEEPHLVGRAIGVRGPGVLRGRSRLAKRGHLPAGNSAPLNSLNSHGRFVFFGLRWCVGGRVGGTRRGYASWQHGRGGGCLLGNRRPSSGRGFVCRTPTRRHGPDALLWGGARGVRLVRVQL